MFFLLLHNARRLKKIGWARPNRRAYLLGMLRTYIEMVFGKGDIK